MGADFVMMGRYFARFDEAPGRKVRLNNQIHEGVLGRGLEPYAQLAALRSRRQRQQEEEDQMEFEEGVDSYVPYAGKLKDNLDTTLAKVRSTMCNCGSLTCCVISTSAHGSPWRSAVSIHEGGVHDVMLKDLRNNCAQRSLRARARRAPRLRCAERRAGLRAFAVQVRTSAVATARSRRRRSVSRTRLRRASRARWAPHRRVVGRNPDTGAAKSAEALAMPGPRGAPPRRTPGFRLSARARSHTDRPPWLGLGERPVLRAREFHPPGPTRRRCSEERLRAWSIHRVAKHAIEPGHGRFVASQAYHLVHAAQKGVLEDLLGQRAVARLLAPEIRGIHDSWP